MSSDPFDIATNLGFAALGFLTKFLIERYARHRDAVRFESWRLEVASLEQKLSQFYWPIYCRLLRGAIAWKSGNFRKETDTEDGKNFIAAFDLDVVVRNHEETRDIIQANFHHFGGDKKLEAALVKLLHHIDVYLALRASGSKNDPIWVGQPWPYEIETLIEENLHKLQTRYDQLLSLARNPG